MDDHTVTVDSARVLSHWAAVRKASAHRRLSDSSVEIYSGVWSSWCEFLAGSKLSWHEARPTDVHAFLASRPALRKDRSGATTVTQARYARVLKGIYSKAVAAGWLTRNPVDKDSLTATSERHESLAFNSNDWAVLLSAAPESTGRWQDVRNASILQLWLRAGLTVGEVRALTLGDVLHPSLRWRRGLPMLAAPLLLDAQAPRLVVGGNRPAQARTLALEPPAAQALMTWLAVRIALPYSTSASSPLYPSQQGGGTLSDKSLFVLGNGFIRNALRHRYGPDELAHAGPMQLRSSCIVRWLDASLPEAEVLKLAGLQDSDALRRFHRRMTRPGANHRQDSGADAVQQGVSGGDLP